MKPLDYTIIVPSRRRAHNMGTIKLLLPTAIVCVDEREVDDYAAVMPKPRLLVHPPLDGLPAVMNWIQDNTPQPILVEIDDDFAGIQVTTGSRRFITDSEEILAVIENSAQACCDLELSVFCWSRTPNTTVIHPEWRPVVPTQAVCAAFGVMGAARHRKYDTRLTGRADIDFALQTLLKDRLLYADIRFFFDTGDAFGGRGGNVGVVTAEQFTAASRGLVERWGSALSLKAPGFAKKRQVAPLRLAVSRTNKVAQR